MPDPKAPDWIDRAAEQIAPMLPHNPLGLGRAELVAEIIRREWEKTVPGDGDLAVVTGMVAAAIVESGAMDLHWPDGYAPVLEIAVSGQRFRLRIERVSPELNPTGT